MIKGLYFETSFMRGWKKNNYCTRSSISYGAYCGAGKKQLLHAQLHLLRCVLRGWSKLLLLQLLLHGVLHDGRLGDALWMLMHRLNIRSWDMVLSGRGDTGEERYSLRAHGL